MKILPLFDGMACGLLAFQSAGIPIDNYHAYEIDNYAVRTSQHNFPEIKHHGDVFDGDFTQYRGFDWVIGGSPCTYWSIAQNPAKREKTASGLGWELFQQFIRALQEAQPEYFLYENNFSMAREIRDSISQEFGFEPVMINSALVSAQNRKRLYWLGKRICGRYVKCRAELPEDRGLLVKDILDNGYPAEFPCFTTADCCKSLALTAKRIQHGQGFDPVKYSAEHTPSTNCAVRIGTLPNHAKNQAHDSEQYRVYDISGKSVSLKANGGGLGAKTGLYAIKSDKPDKKYRIYEVRNCQIQQDGKIYPMKVPDGFYIIRKLSVSECKRLQTVPDWYEFPVSDTQAYKMLGNGWTVEVIAHLLKSALQNQAEESCLQLALF